MLRIIAIIELIFIENSNVEKVMLYYISELLRSTAGFFVYKINRIPNDFFERGGL